ncbi:MAG: hypothetical protein IKS52_13220 [Clostridia bacterium]|nr:hypothetical protein [Clostridia bacterium]MBO4886482.1 hypothetical protein [Clostridia bacterium]MBR4444216.1 hypothetical protein [Clostridia bacterium]
MTSYDLKKMNRAALIEQATLLMRENESLAERIENLEAQLKETREKLKSRTIEIGNAGSIAEAAIKLNGVFESAQASADQYLENIERLKRETKAECERLLEETRLKCQEMEIGTQRSCNELYRAAQEEAMQNWSRVSHALEDTMAQFVPKGSTGKDGNT